MNGLNMTTIALVVIGSLGYLILNSALLRRSSTLSPEGKVNCREHSFRHLSTWLVEILEVNTKHRMSLIVTALILSGGVLSSVNAEQPAGGPPIYTADAPPSYQEPPPLLRQNSDIHYVSSELTPSPSQSPGLTPGTPASRLVHARTDQGVRYISGGVGEGERTELNSLSNQFNLRLLFAMQGSGEYLSAVRVNILDTQGASVLNIESKGPWFFAQLAPGDYIVEASATDQGQPSPHRQTTHIDSSGQSRLDFYWR